MSATHRELRWSVVVQDYEHWTAEHRAAAEAEPGGSYDDYAAGLLAEAMHAAGDRFIAEHRDLFRGDLV